MLKSLILASIFMNSDVVFVGLWFDSNPESSPESLIAKVAETTHAQGLIVKNHDAISIFQEDGSSYHALALAAGRPNPPLQSFEVLSTDLCVEINNETEIEQNLRALDDRDDLIDDAYLRTTFDLEHGKPRFFACRPRRG